MAAMQNLTETVEILGPPFTVKGVRNALARGKFRGLGRKWGGQWFTTADDRATMLERLRVPADEPAPEPKRIPSVGDTGLSARSPLAKQIAATASGVSARSPRVRAARAAVRPQL